MSRSLDLTDESVVVVIGSGAGGAVVANELAQKGIDVVCLEAGRRLAMKDIVNDPFVMEERMGWRDERRGAPVWLCKTVGGTTMRWAAACPRFLAHEFRARSTYGALEDTSLIDWPISLKDLAPYYDQAEAKMGVSGTHGLPPSPETNNFKVLKAGARRVGYRDITSAHIAINPEANDGRPGCLQIGFCLYGCAIGAKWSTLYTEIPKAERTDHFELRSEAMAVRITQGPDGRVRSVVYRDESGALQEQRARAVCVACNVVETTRLLLLSESNRFPEGLANRSGQVGRNYMRHMSNFVYAMMPKPVNLHRGARICGLVRDGHAHDPRRGFAGGFLFEPGAATPEGMSNFAGWGELAKHWMEHYTYLAGTLMVGEDLPQVSNRIHLHPTDRDEFGLPVPILEYTHHPNTRAMLKYVTARGHEIYASLGATDIRDDSDQLGGGCHNMGVARMSEDPRDGVTNRWGQTHDVSNLFISDGSVFSSSGAANPTLTIVALAIRQADHIAERMRRHEL